MSDSAHLNGSGTPSTAPGYLHQLGIYGSDEGFRSLVYPFALGGLEAGEPVVFGYDTYKMELLRNWLPDTPTISYVTDTSPYNTPATALAGWRRLVEGHLAAGASRVRIAGNVPHPGYGRPYAGWDRYEAAIDRAWGDLPVWAPCLYDARITPDDVLARARRSHHHLLGPDDTHETNDAFEPAERLRDFLAPPPHPIEETAPTFDLVDPTPGAVRSAIKLVGATLSEPEQADHLLLAASEAATNALVHGMPPVSVRIWAGGNVVVVKVHDHGDGPADPLAGLLPKGEDDAGSGRGLWLAHQLDIDVALIAAGDGFTVRLQAGDELPVN